MELQQVLPTLHHWDTVMTRFCVLLQYFVSPNWVLGMGTEQYSSVLQLVATDVERFVEISRFFRHSNCFPPNETVKKR